MIRISIVNSNTNKSGYMAQNLAHQADMRIIHQLPTASEAMVRIGSDTCHVILVSAALPHADAMKLIRHFKGYSSNVRTIMTDLPNDKEQIMRYVLAGAAGYTLKGDSIAKLTETIRATHQGKAIISDEIAALLMSQIAKLSLVHRQSSPCTAVHSELTTRESDVLQLLAEGCSNKAIADRLIISIGTVKNHVHNVLKKLNLHSRKEAARYLAHLNGHANFSRQRYAGQLI